MEKNKFSPDVRNGSSYVKLYSLTFGVIALIVSMIVLSVYLYNKKNSGEKNENQAYVSKVESSGLPSDFFTGSDYFEEEEPEPEPEPKTFNEEPREKIIYKTVYIEKEPEKISLSAGAMFEKTKNIIDPETLRKRELRRKIHEQRISSGGLTKVAINDNMHTSMNPKNNSTDNNWNKYGVSQDKASYPVKLDRVITVDRMISCILVNEIISDLQGKVTCKVEENIYGAHGRKILIPAHSTGIGYYQPLKRIGDERIGVKWARIITPEGININTTDAQIADQMGRSGITGDVDNRYSQRYGLALLSSAISSAASYSIPVDNINQQIVVSNMTQDLGTVTNKILDEHINIKPRVTIPAGTRVFINPVVDIWFPEPKSNTNEINAQKL